MAMCESDTVNVVLPESGAEELTRLLIGCGPIACFNQLPLETPTAAVTYYDLRHALLAANTCGDACTFGENQGNRIVRLPGDVNIKEQDVQFCKKFVLDEESGAYDIEFFDSRVAETYRAQYALTHMKITGFPNSLCTFDCVDAVMQQAGLAQPGCIVQHQAIPGPPKGAASKDGTGQIIVTIRGSENVKKCMRHFHGRQWDPDGEPVRVKIVADPAAKPKAPRRGPPTAPLLETPPGLAAPPGLPAPPPGLEAPLAHWKPKDEPMKVMGTASKDSSEAWVSLARRLGTRTAEEKGEDSTEAGTSEGDDDLLRDDLVTVA